jgi:hypothetical protein
MQCVDFSIDVDWSSYVNNKEAIPSYNTVIAIWIFFSPLGNDVLISGSFVFLAIEGGPFSLPLQWEEAKTLLGSK